ncbi:unnamed protein product [Prunus brigantina]
MVSDSLSSGALAWSRRHLYTLHCLGVLLNCQQNNPYAHIRDKYGLITNLVEGLQFPSEEIRGEILFVLYKVSVLQYASEVGVGTDFLFAFRPKLLSLSLEALMKTQSDDVRLNCVTFLTMLAQRGLFGAAYAVDLNSNGSSKDATPCLPSDPIDFLILLEQKNSRNLELSSCQSAISLISYTSSLYDERTDLQGGSTDPFTVMRLVYLYGHYKGLTNSNPYTHIRDKYGLITNLVEGLELPSKDIRGEILFVLYKVSFLQYASEVGDGTDFLFAFCPKLLDLSLEAP